jgi:hypothetical protein
MSCIRTPQGGAYGAQVDLCTCHARQEAQCIRHCCPQIEQSKVQLQKPPSACQARKAARNCHATRKEEAKCQTRQCPGTRLIWFTKVTTKQTQAQSTIWCCVQGCLAAQYQLTALPPRLLLKLRQQRTQHARPLMVQQVCTCISMYDGLHAHLINKLLGLRTPGLIQQQGTRKPLVHTCMHACFNRQA